MFNWTRQKWNRFYKPDWANSILAYNHNFRSCTQCGTMIKDGAWFKIQRENGHYLVFDSDFCMLAYDKKHSAKPD